MKIKSLIKVVGSCVLVIVLALTMTIVVISPQTVSAQTITKSKALEALKEGIKADDDGDDDDAKFFYEEAIDEVLSNKDVEVLIEAKIRLAALKEQDNLKDEAKKLLKEAEAGNKVLGLDTALAGACGDCQTSAGGTGRPRALGGCNPCVRP